LFNITAAKKTQEKDACFVCKIKIYFTDSQSENGWRSQSEILLHLTSNTIFFYLFDV
jgi:hypothetical protein